MNDPVIGELSIDSIYKACIEKFGGDFILATQIQQCLNWMLPGLVQGTLRQQLFQIEHVRKYYYPDEQLEWDFPGPTQCLYSNEVQEVVKSSLEINDKEWTGQIRNICEAQEYKAAYIALQDQEVKECAADDFPSTNHEIQHQLVQQLFEAMMNNKGTYQSFARAAKRRVKEHDMTRTMEQGQEITQPNDIDECATGLKKESILVEIVCWHLLVSLLRLFFNCYNHADC